MRRRKVEARLLRQVVTFSELGEINQFSDSQIKICSFTHTQKMISSLDSLAISRNINHPESGVFEFLKCSFQYFAVASNVLTHSLMCEKSRQQCTPFAVLMVLRIYIKQKLLICNITEVLKLISCF